MSGRRGRDSTILRYVAFGLALIVAMMILVFFVIPLVTIITIAVIVMVLIGLIVTAIRNIFSRDSSR